MGTSRDGLGRELRGIAQESRTSQEEEQRLKRQAEEARRRADEESREEEERRWADLADEVSQDAIERRCADIIAACRDAARRGDMRVVFTLDPFPFVLRHRLASEGRSFSACEEKARRRLDWVFFDVDVHFDRHGGVSAEKPFMTSYTTTRYELRFNDIGEQLLDELRGHGLDVSGSVPSGYASRRLTASIHASWSGDGP